MRRIFFNLNEATDALPGILTVCLPEGIYYGRMIHAEADHYIPPSLRRKLPFRHMHYHIVLVTGGAGSFEIANRVLPAKPGTVFFTSPSQSHQFLNADHDTTHYAELTFEFVRSDGTPLGLDFSELLSLWIHQPCDPVVCHELTPAQAHLLGDEISSLVNRGLAGPRPDNLELGGLLADVLTMIFRAVFQRGAAPLDPIHRARDIIRASYREKLRLTTLAKEAGMSPPHFSRQFKRCFGRAPIDYQLDLRLQSACELLRTSSEPLSTIAGAVGFDDVYYFSRLFRRRLGETPGRFRRAVQPD